MEIVASDSGRRRAVAREAEYWSIGVPEVWRVDIERELLTVLRPKNDSGYEASFQASRGVVRSRKIRGLELLTEWLWMPQAKRPPVAGIVQKLLRRHKRS